MKPTKTRQILKIGNDELVNTLSFLDLPSVYSFKFSCKKHYHLINHADPHFTNHLIMLALQTIPPVASLAHVVDAKDDEYQQVIDKLKRTTHQLAELRWNKTMDRFNLALEEYRDIGEDHLTNEQKAQYQLLVEELAAQYLRSDVEKKTCQDDDEFEGTQFFLQDRNMCEYTQQFEMDMVFGYILGGNDLSVTERDRYITELINERVGVLSTNS